MLGGNLFFGGEASGNQEGSGGVNPCSSAHALDVFTVHPVELGFVEDGILARDAIEAELAAQYVTRDDGGFSVERPTQKREEIYQGVGQVTHFLVLLN